METRRLDDPAQFLELAGPLLGADEARHNLIFGLAATLGDDPSSYPSKHLWVVVDGERPVAAALQTPRLNVILARPSADGALGVLAHAVANDSPEVSGVNGAVPEVDDFATEWVRRTGMAAQIGTELRVYALTQVQPVESVPGAARQATAADVELLRTWIRAFMEEGLHADDSNIEEHVERTLRGRLRRRSAGFLLWVDGEPVSLAGWGGPTPNGIRIGPVYTPPELRRRGYASALSAELSAQQLAAGRRFCFLYTDAANPTSNKIYVDIGYQHVCDSRELSFDARSR